MNSGTDKIGPRTDASRREADHPRQTYQTPANVVTDDKLNRRQKLDILRYWKDDVEAQLKTDSEGMGQSEPLAPEAETTLTDEQRLVGRAIERLQK